MPCIGVPYTRKLEDCRYQAPERDEVLSDGFDTGITEPTLENTGSGAFCRSMPTVAITEGDGVTRPDSCTWVVAADTVIRDRVINGRVILGERAHLYNCLITGPDAECMFNTALIIGPGQGDRARVEFCTIDPTVASPFYDGIADGLDVRRTTIINVTDGVRGFNQITGMCRIRMTGSVIESLTQFTPDYATGNRPETHNDAAQMQGNPSGDVTDLEFIGCAFNAYHSTTKGDVAELHRAELSALMLSPNVGSIHVTFRDGWLRGGIFCVNAGNDGLAGSELTVTNCRFERPGTSPNAPDVAFAVDSSLQPGLIQSGNIFIDNGEPVPISGA